MTDSIYIVWKRYQRRAEVFSKRINARLIFFPHYFREKFFRPIDYILKFLLSLRFLFKGKAKLVFLQAPPLFSCLPAYYLHIPYVIDAHNPVFQEVGGKISWGKLPLSRNIIENAKAVVVHNHGILEVGQAQFPDQVFFTIPDPIDSISAIRKERIQNQILVICSFDPDEPVEVILKSISKLQNHVFIITADLLKLPKYLQQKLQNLPNVRLTGFLPNDEYQQILCESSAALVLTDQDLIQPSGACEALSSNTPLIISNTPLIAELFGDWAILVDNTSDSITAAIQELKPTALDLSKYRDAWNNNVYSGIEKMLNYLNENN